MQDGICQHIITVQSTLKRSLHREKVLAFACCRAAFDHDIRNSVAGRREPVLRSPVSGSHYTIVSQLVKKFSLE